MFARGVRRCWYYNLGNTKSFVDFISRPRQIPDLCHRCQIVLNSSKANFSYSQLNQRQRISAKAKNFHLSRTAVEGSGRLDTASTYFSGSGFLCGNSRRQFLRTCLFLHRPWLNFSSESGSTGMDLKDVMSALRQLAPESLAESWDNVGLLVEPSPPHTVRRLLLTNDLTPSVMKEAMESKIDMILSYHPPIFAPLKRVTQGNWKERLVVQCLENRIALYSPHTAYDALAGGVNDWLISAFDVAEVKPISVSESAGANSHQVTAIAEEWNVGVIKSSLLAQTGCSDLPFSVVPQLRMGDGPGMVEIAVTCRQGHLAGVLAVFKSHHVHNLTTVQLSKVPLAGMGMGRWGRLTKALTLTQAVEKVKGHLKLPHLRLAASPEVTNITTVAVCAGSGSSVLRGAKADLYVTGEMSHHDVLAAVHSDGACVLLCDHSNSERGFLQQLAATLGGRLGKGVDVVVSRQDADPLTVV